MTQKEKEQIIENSEKISEINAYRQRVTNNNFDIFIDRIEWNLFEEVTGIDMVDFAESIKKELLNKIDQKIEEISSNMKKIFQDKKSKK